MLSWLLQSPLKRGVLQWWSWWEDVFSALFCKGDLEMVSMAVGCATSPAGLGAAPGSPFGLKREHIPERLSNDSPRLVTFWGDYQSFGRWVSGVSALGTTDVCSEAISGCADFSCRPQSWSQLLGAAALHRAASGSAARAGLSLGRAVLLQGKIYPPVGIAYSLFLNNILKSKQHI